MSVINSIPLIAAGDDGYQISRSVRLRSSASAYFSRFVGTSNRKTFTFSGWVKKAVVGSSTGAVLFCSTDNATSTGWLHFNLAAVGSADTLTFQDQLSNTVLVTTQLFRDPSAWYHIILVVDTTQATASNRAKLFVNGTQVTAFSTATYPSQNADTNFNRPTSFIHTIGTQIAGGRYFDGYLAEINFIDGQALTPSSFGETNALTGVWQPKAYSGTYGTNGFYLNFSDNSGATAATIGKDNSGNGNNWTPNNISVTSGVTYDSMLDVPTPYVDGGNGRGNYAVLNPLQLPTIASTVLSNANLLLTCNSGNSYNSFANGTMYPTSGKYYAEFYVNTVGETYVGISRFTDASTPNSWNSQSTYYNKGGVIQKDNATIFSVATYTTGDTIGVAYDVDNATCAFYKNNTLVGTVTGVTAGLYTFSIAGYFSAAISFNTGQRPFTYTPPTGFVALNTQNLPTPTISNGANYMAATTYTGTGSALSVSNAVNGVSFQPDFVWTKPRSTAVGHTLFDSLRGVTKYLQSNTTGAEGTAATSLTAFNSDGFTVNSDTSTGANGVTYIGWQWNAGGSTVTNTSGSISAQVRANPTAGFSVVTFTAPASGNFSAGHGLNVTPGMVITKVRGRATSWITWHNRLNSGSPGTSYYVELNTTSAQSSFASVWGSTGVTSSVIGMGVGASCAASDTIVAYCFAAVAGYSAFGSYTGNGSADGPFVFTGFRPRFVMFKKSSAAEDWLIFDTTRNASNLTNLQLYPNMSSAEATGVAGVIDILSNGFKIRGTSDALNTNGGTYIFMAVAENPFKLSLAR